MKTTDLKGIKTAETDNIERLLACELPGRFTSEFKPQTVLDYLHDLLHRLWDWGKNFNPHYPMGDSDWEYILLNAMVLNGFIDGEIAVEDDGNRHVISIPDEDVNIGNNLIFQAITHIFLQSQ